MKVTATFSRRSGLPGNRHRGDGPTPRYPEPERPAKSRFGRPSSGGGSRPHAACHVSAVGAGHGEGGLSGNDPAGHTCTCPGTWPGASRTAPARAPMDAAARPSAHELRREGRLRARGHGRRAAEAPGRGIRELQSTHPERLPKTLPVARLLLGRRL